MSNYQIDGADVNQEPHQHQWTEKEPLGFDHSGIPTYRPLRSCTLSFDVMTETDFRQWAIKDDAAKHTATLPHPDSGVFTQFSDVVIQVARHRRRDINVYDIDIKISRVAGLVP